MGCEVCNDSVMALSKHTKESVMQYIFMETNGTGAKL